MRDDGKPYSLDALYPDQREIVMVVLDKVKEWLECEDISTFVPLAMTINGPGGSGKSVVIQTIVAILRKMFNCNGVAQVAAPTGSAAFNVNGETLHRLVSMGITKTQEPMTLHKRKKLVKKFETMLCLVIDERSLLSASDLGKAEDRIAQTIYNSSGNSSQFFGGLPVFILVGDDYQLPAQDGPIQNIDRNFFGNTTARGMQVFMNAGKKVVHLETSKRMSDSKKDQKLLLEKVRLGAMDLCQREVSKLLSLHLDKIQELHGSKTVAQIESKAVFLFYTNKKKDTKNMQMLHDTSTPDNPVAIVKPKSMGPRGGKGISSHFSDSKPMQCCFLCIGARVAIDAINYNPAWGLYNGACGTVTEIVFLSQGSNPNNGDMPDYVVVDFPSYTGPIWDQGNPTCVPIPKATLQCSKKCCERQMIPLVLAWAITVHRFQGQSAGPVDPGKIPNSYDCIVCDPHDTTAERNHLGVFYTAISRATTLGDDNGLNSAFYFIGNNVTQERFQNIGRKQGSRDYFQSYVRRSKWVTMLKQNTYSPNITEEQSRELGRWARTTILSPETLANLLRTRAALIH